MKTRRHTQYGYTLAELLISLAIIAMISGLAIPAVTKIGGFMSKKSDSAARDLYGVLRAARISAISYRNDTAVVYVVNDHIDNSIGSPTFVIDGYGMATRATQDQYERIIAADNRFNAASPYEVFVLAKDPQAKFRKMPPHTAVIGHLTSQEEQLPCIRGAGYVDLAPQTLDEFYNGRSDLDPDCNPYHGMVSRGMRMVYLFHESDADTLEPLQPHVVFPYALTGGPPSKELIEGYAFPAHVFVPTGELDAPQGSDGQPKERITIAVGPSPDAPKEDRFTVTPEEGAGPTQMASPVRIEVYRSTGRVQIAS